MAIRLPIAFIIFKRTRFLFYFFKFITPLFQKCIIISSAHFPGVPQFTVLIKSDMQGPETNSFALWFCKSTDYQFLAFNTLKLQPFFAPAVHVCRLPILCDDTFPSFLARLLVVFFSFLVAVADIVDGGFPCDFTFKHPLPRLECNFF